MVRLKFDKSLICNENATPSSFSPLNVFILKHEFMSVQRGLTLHIKTREKGQFRRPPRSDASSSLPCFSLFNTIQTPRRFMDINN